MIDKNIQAAMDGLDPVAMQCALNKFVNMARPNQEKIDAKSTELDRLVNKKAKVEPANANASPSQSTSSSSEPSPICTPLFPKAKPFVELNAEARLNFLNEKKADQTKLQTEIEVLEAFSVLDEEEVDLEVLGELMEIKVPSPITVRPIDFVTKLLEDKRKKSKTLALTMDLLSKKCT